jgi:hypothetical protein
MVRWVTELEAVATCQCFTPGGVTIPEYKGIEAF